MNNNIIKSAIFAGILALAVSTLHAESSADPQYNKSEMIGMMRTAHTADQYRTLAGYFRAQEQQFEQKASSEKQELDRRSANVTSISAKYPRPVDSSKNRYEYFTYKAHEMEQKAAHYESLSASAR
jgi:hypothetical protein